MKRVRIIDSHTGGEPTRTVISGGPDLGNGTVAERAERFGEEWNDFRSGVINEPRGSEVLVGALLVPPVDPAAACGVIFFNNVGVLGMCGHGTIGLVETLAYLGRIGPGRHLIETPVGPVTAQRHTDGRISVRNVVSYRGASGVVVPVPGLGEVTGDVVWGGNWFFLVKEPRNNLSPAGIESLTAEAWKVRQAVNAAGYPEVDHVEFFGPPHDPGNHSRNFVLCPGKAWDRSPCGTGTSAKLACLAADGKLQPGEIWRQESVIGSVFEGAYETEGEHIIPTITGRAWITAETVLCFDPSDPFADGICQI
jgi:4-hydroxyproline epimerase